MDDEKKIIFEIKGNGFFVRFSVPESNNITFDWIKYVQKMINHAREEINNKD